MCACSKDYKAARIEVSALIFNVLTQKISVLEALKNYPKIQGDATLNTAFHALVHFEADEDLRKRDSLYRDEQDMYLEDMANILSKGEALPFNIIKEYNEYHDDSLIYPEMNNKTILERLKKMINL